MRTGLLADLYSHRLSGLTARSGVLYSNNRIALSGNNQTTVRRRVERVVGVSPTLHPSFRPRCPSLAGFRKPTSVSCGVSRSTISRSTRPAFGLTARIIGPQDV